MMTKLLLLLGMAQTVFSDDSNADEDIVDTGSDLGFTNLGDAKLCTAESDR